MKIKFTLLLQLLLLSNFFCAEEKIVLHANKLSEVVVTGQFEPQSIKKSVFNVRVISSQDIKI